MPKKKRAKTKAKVESDSVFSRFELTRIRQIYSNNVLSLAKEGHPTKNSLKINVRPDFQRQSKAAIVVVSCEIEVRYEEADPEADPAIQIQCDYAAEYRCTSKAFPSAKTVIAYEPEIIVGGVMMLWPYLRRHIHSTAAEMVVPLINLPIAMPMIDTETGDVYVSINGHRLQLVRKGE